MTATLQDIHETNPTVALLLCNSAHWGKKLLSVSEKKILESRGHRKFHF